MTVRTMRDSEYGLIPSDAYNAIRGAQLLLAGDRAIDPGVRHSLAERLRLALEDTLREEIPDDLDDGPGPLISLPLRCDLAPWVYHTSSTAHAYRADLPDDDDRAVLDLTIGWTPGSRVFGAQTGDNSFSGGAYGYVHWAVVSVPEHVTETEVGEIASEILSQLANLAAS